MIQRDRCAALLKMHMQTDAIVVAGLGTASRAWRAQQAPQPTYYVSDPMGIGLAMALGFALAQPSREVVFLGGDGDFIMSLGSLLTVAGSGVKNLKVVTFQNSRYETGGGQPLVASDRFSLATIARGAGFEQVLDVADEAQAVEDIRTFLGWEDLGLLVLRTAAEPSPYPKAGPWSQVEERAFFMRQVHGDAGPLPCRD